MPVMVMWTVKTSGIFPIQPGISFLSSKFYIENTRSTEFCLRIRGEFPGSEEDHVGSLFLCRCDNNGPEKIGVEYRLTSCHGERVTTYRRQFLKPQRDVSYWCCETDTLPVMAQATSGGELMVGCLILSYQNDGYVDLEHRDEDDFVNLSNEFCELFLNPLFPDSIIETPHKIFKCHKSFFEVRCPPMLKECKTLRTQGEFSKYDDDILQKLLYYIYTGKLKSESAPDELYFMLEQYDSFFNRLLLGVPYYVHLRTSFNLKKIHFHWAIENFLNYSQSQKFCYKITDGDPSDWLKLTFITFQSEDMVQHLKFMMHRMSKTTTALVECKIQIFLSDGNLAAIFEETHLFVDEQPWIVRFDEEIMRNDEEMTRIREKLHSGEVEFYIELGISGGDLTNSVKSIKILSNSSHNINEKLYGLGCDMGKLYQNSQYSDVNLKVKNKTIPAHRGILSARSPRFRKMLQQDIPQAQHSSKDQQHLSPEIVITDLDEKIALSMIYYIYSAQVVDLDVDLAFELYNAAVLYKISQLKIKCAKYLKSSLDVTNVGEIILLGNAQDDYDLKSSAYEFINSKPDAMRKSKMLIGIMKCFNYFGSRKLKDFFKKSERKKYFN